MALVINARLNAAFERNLKDWGVRAQTSAKDSDSSCQSPGQPSVAVSWSTMAVQPPPSVVMSHTKVASPQAGGSRV